MQHELGRGTFFEKVFWVQVWRMLKVQKKLGMRFEKCHLDSHFSSRAKGPSMSCDRQRPKYESAFKTFFALSTFAKLGPKMPFQKKKFLGPNLCCMPLSFLHRHIDLHSAIMRIPTLAVDGHMR